LISQAFLPYFVNIFFKRPLSPKFSQEPEKYADASPEAIAEVKMEASGREEALCYVMLYCMYSPKIAFKRSDFEIVLCDVVAKTITFWPLVGRQTMA